MTGTFRVWRSSLGAAGFIPTLTLALLTCSTGYSTSVNQGTQTTQATEQAVKTVEDDLLSEEIASLETLAGKFLGEQSGYQELTPPDGDFILRQDGGMVVFDPKNFPKSFTDGLVGTMEYYASDQIMRLKT